MTRLLLFISIIVMCASCGNGGGGNFKDSTSTLVITDTCAVIFHPTGDKLTYLKNTFNKNSFAAMEQSNNAALVADSAYLAKMGVKIISTSKLKLKFHKKNGEDVDINLMHEKYAWEVFLFDSYNDPIKADITDIETATQEAGIR